jgi:hypothetical protein
VASSIDGYRSSVLATAAAIMLPILAMGAGVWLSLTIMERHRRALERGSCPQCNYDVSGIEVHVCPECGYPIHATHSIGRLQTLAELAVLPAIALAQVLMLPGALAIAERLGDALPVVPAPMWRSAVVSAIMLLSTLLIGAAFTVRRTPRELTGVLLVYLVGAVDTGIAWFVVLAAAT